MLWPTFTCRIRSTSPEIRTLANVMVQIATFAAAPGSLLPLSRLSECLMKWLHSLLRWGTFGNNYFWIKDSLPRGTGRGRIVRWYRTKCCEEIVHVSGSKPQLVKTTTLSHHHVIDFACPKASNFHIQPHQLFEHRSSDDPCSGSASG